MVDDNLVFGYSVAFTAFGAATLVNLAGLRDALTAELILFAILGYGSLCVAFQKAYGEPTAPMEMSKLVSGSLGYTISTGGWRALRQVL